MEFKELFERVLSDYEGTKLRIHSLKESPCSQPGQNFMSVVGLARVEGELENGTPYSRSVFIKRPPPSGHVQFGVDEAFTNEVLMYQQVLPLLASTSDVIIPCPRHYHATGDVILLEDLGVEGYAVGDVAQGFDLATARRVVQMLAKFHAASNITSVVEKEKFFETIRNLNPLGLMVSSNRNMMETCIQRTIQYLVAEDDLKPAVKFLRELQGRVTDKIRELRRPKHIAVLVHGDFWFNNILTRKEEGCEVLDENRCRIIDLQACAFQSPAIDLWLFLYTSIDPTILSSDCETFVQLYCSTFLNVLKNQNILAEKIPSLASLEEEFFSKELYGFLAAMAYLPAVYFKRDSVAEMGKATEEEMKQEGFLDKFVGPQYKERVIEVTRYCFKKGVLS